VPRVGLVLGAGGITGGAFHAGVLSALAERLGWDPNTADLIVGTSAGSVTAASLRAGLSAGDLARRSEGLPLSPDGSAIISAAALGRNAPPAPPRPGRPRAGPPAAPGVLLAAARRPWYVRPGAVIAGLLPEGTMPTGSIADSIDALTGGGWPSRPLWICAVRLDDARLVVFGRADAPPASLGEAVAASCAIPAYFSPVMIGGRRHVDGGAFSLTNLTQVSGLGLDLVVVSAPMSRAGRRHAPGSLVRAAARAQLDIEAHRVQRSGTPVVAFHPTAEDLAAMGPDAMDARRRAGVTRQARRSTLSHLGRTDIRGQLEVLGA
jgi:NTE family protein